MPFKKGVRLPGQGGKRKNAGRKPNGYRKVRQSAEQLAREFIEAHVKPVLETYGKAAMGEWVTQVDPITGQEQKAYIFNAQILKHYMDRVIPPRAPEDKEGNSVAPILYVHPNLEDEK
jgi:hypothetical protein